MDPLHPHSEVHPTPRESIERELRTLRLTVQITLVSLVILSGSLGVYLFRQVSLLRRQVIASDRMARQMAVQFNLNVATQAVRIERQLLDFARSNPAFNARISRLYVSTATPPSEVLPSAPPDPAPTSTPPASPP